MYFENSRAHGTLCTLCQSSDLSDLSDILCPQYRHCAMRSASRWECALFSGERHAHGAGVRHLAGRARSHVLWNFRGTGHPHSHVPIVRTSPYKSVQVRIPLPAPCALRKVLCQPMGLRFAFFERYAHGARGETSLFPPCPPFRPACCMEACGTQCSFFKLEALAPFPAGAGNRAA